MRCLVGDGMWEGRLLAEGLVEHLEAVVLGAQPYSVGIVDGVSAMFPVDAFLKRLGVVVVGGGGMEHEVEAGLVEGHRVGRGEDADILHLRLFGVGDAVAVDREVVHDVDI